MDFRKPRVNYIDTKLFPITWSVTEPANVTHGICNSFSATLSRRRNFVLLVLSRTTNCKLYLYDHRRFQIDQVRRCSRWSKGLKFFQKRILILTQAAVLVYGFYTWHNSNCGGRGQNDFRKHLCCQAQTILCGYRFCN